MPPPPCGDPRHSPSRPTNSAAPAVPPLRVSVGTAPTPFPSSDPGIGGPQRRGVRCYGPRPRDPRRASRSMEHRRPRTPSHPPPAPTQSAPLCPLPRAPRPHASTPVERRQPCPVSIHLVHANRVHPRRRLRLPFANRCRTALPLPRPSWPGGPCCCCHPLSCHHGPLVPRPRCPPRHPVALPQLSCAADILHRPLRPPCRTNQIEFDLHLVNPDSCYDQDQPSTALALLPRQLHGGQVQEKQIAVIVRTVADDMMGLRGVDNEGCCA